MNYSKLFALFNAGFDFGVLSSNMISYFKSPSFEELKVRVISAL
jgi:hypothetical protein